MGNEVSTSSNKDFLDVYELMAALAGDDYTRSNAIKYMNLLIALSRSDFTVTEVRRAIGFIEAFSLSLSNLRSDQMAELFDLIRANRKAAGDGF